MNKKLLLSVIILCIPFSIYSETYSSIFENAKNNHIPSQIRLAEMYYSGDGVTKDIEKAKYWYTKAAELGSIKAQAELGDIYFLDLPVNIEMAEYWYDKAAKQGHFSSQTGLYLLYSGRFDKPRNPLLAYAWLSIALEQKKHISNNSSISDLKNTHSLHRKLLSKQDLVEVQKTISELKRIINTNLKN